jgi:hypothetical protein
VSREEVVEGEEGGLDPFPRVFNRLGALVTTLKSGDIVALHVGMVEGSLCWPRTRRRACAL